MDVRQALARLGGVADRATLIDLTTRAVVDAALRSGAVVAVARGKYALPVADEALRVAAALGGTVSHLSAALHWGWEVKSVPPLPEVTVPRHRRLGDREVPARLHWADLPDDDRAGLLTSPRRTVIDCLRHASFDEALSVADSALRHSALDADVLASLASGIRGPGAIGARRVAGQASALAANPFESVLRAISLDVPGLRLVPQVVIRDDARRYNHLVVRGWRVLRFSWEDVMHDPAYVRAILGAATKATSRGG